MTPVSTAPDKTADRIAGMFDAIAPRYDLLNHLLSAGIDKRWRARMIRSLELTDRKSTRLNSSHIPLSRMPSSA